MDCSFRALSISSGPHHHHYRRLSSAASPKLLHHLLRILRPQLPAHKLLVHHNRGLQRIVALRDTLEEPRPPPSRNRPKKPTYKPGDNNNSSSRKAPSRTTSRSLRTWTAGRRTPLERKRTRIKDGSQGFVDKETFLESRESGSKADASETFLDAPESELSGSDIEELEQRGGDGIDAELEAEALTLIGSTSTSLHCQHFARCSGCTLDTALDKPPIYKDAVRFFRGHGIRNLSLTTGSVVEWRCRAKLSVQGTAENPLIGLYEEGTHEVVDIPACRAHHPRINETVELLKEGIRELGVHPYNENSGQGELRYIQMAVTTYDTSIPVSERYANGKVQVTLVWNARSEQSSSGVLLTSIAEFLWQKGGSNSAHPILHSIWANFQTSRTNAIFGGRWRHILGEQQLWERLGGVDISLTPASFAQANPEAFESLLRNLQKYVKSGSSVVEFYAGVGVIGLSLAATRACRAVKCVEVNKECRGSFELSLSRLPKSNKSNISWYCTDVSVSPISWLKGADVVIVDPPRKGLDASVIEALRMASLRGQGKSKSASPGKIEKVEKRPWILRAKQDSVQKESIASLDEESTWPEKLIYVSCGWQAFKLDYTALASGNAWHLEAAQAFNFFPGTDSIEVLAVFKRGNKVKAKKKLAASTRASG